MIGIAAQSMLIILLAVLVVLTWHGRKADKLALVRAVCWVLPFMLVAFSVMPAVHELFLAVEGVEPSWRVRLETGIALALVIWRGAWAHG